jgi:hypothetical protein
MESDNWQDGQPSSNNVSQSVPRNYNFLLRMSRRLGNVATQSSFIHDVRSFMNQEITYNSPSRWLDSGIAMLRGSRQEPTTATSNAQQAEAKKERDLKKIVTQSHEILMSANTVFPISLFPDTVTVDRTKVTITKRDFFWSADVMSIRIEDVLNVSASVGPLFGSLTVASRVMSTIDHFQINHFWRSDAIRLKHIIQGYVIAQHNNIDTAHLKKEELIETLLELGVDTNK